MPRINIAAAAATIAALFIAHSDAIPLAERRNVPTWQTTNQFCNTYGYAPQQAGSGFVCGMGKDDSGYLVATDNATWQVTTQSLGKYVWTQDDANTANCLTNLHFAQNDACISTSGSMCAAHAGTSKILNEKTEKQLVSYDSFSIQAASQALVGTSVNGDGGVMIYRLDPSHDLSYIGAVGVYFGGSDQC